MTSKSALKKPSKIGKSGFWQKSAKSRFLQAGIGLKPDLGPLKIGAKSTRHDPSEPSDAACHCIANFFAQKSDPEVAKTLEIIGGGSCCVYGDVHPSDFEPFFGLR